MQKINGTIHLGIFISVLLIAHFLQDTQGYHSFGPALNGHPDSCGDDDALKCPWFRNLARHIPPSEGCPANDTTNRKFGNCASDADCCLGSYCCLSLCQGISRCYNPYVNRFTDHLFNFTGGQPCCKTDDPCPKNQTTPTSVPPSTILSTSQPNTTTEIPTTTTTKVLTTTTTTTTEKPTTTTTEIPTTTKTTTTQKHTSKKIKCTTTPHTTTTTKNTTHPPPPTTTEEFKSTTEYNTTTEAENSTTFEITTTFNSTEAERRTTPIVIKTTEGVTTTQDPRGGEYDDVTELKLDDGGLHKKEEDVRSLA